MFTGIVEEIGHIKNISSGRLIISAKKVLSDVNVGDSIAVNGVCLTVTSFKANEFAVDVMPETL
ncbi:MAG: riboflavin synthase, partial [Selenomonadaceae bacterium]